MQAVLSHYRILEQIGAGGMGVVYRAHDEHLDCDVALKVLPPGKLADEAARKRFRKEALALSKLNHPNIAVVHDFDTQDGTDFLVEELIPGLSLSQMLISGPLPEREIVNLGSQLAEGLQAAHQQGVIHRDLKPANIRVTPDARLKILDFGLASIVQPSSPTALTASETQTLSIAGTLPYMAPEQLLAEKVDFRTDIWAAGCVLYEMATSRPPFLGYGPALIDAILRQPAPAASKLNSRLSPGLEAIILKCLDKNPENRYQSAKELAVDVRRLLTPSAVARQIPRRRFGAGKTILLAAALIVGAVLAGAGYFLLHRSSAPLTNKDTVVLAEFVNSTGDPIFDGTLRQGLSSQLEQSPFLSLLSDQRIAATLSLMAQSKDAQLTPQLASQVCQRTASAATIEGSISSLGSQYVLGLRAVNCRNGDLLAQEQVTANGKEHVLNALGEAATKMRKKLGESLASVQKYDAPPDSITTSSLEALQAYSLGVKARRKVDYPVAISFYQRAITLDPSFAMAYAHLGVVYRQVGLTERGDEDVRKAYELRDRLSEREKFDVGFMYEYWAIGDLEAARRICEMWEQTYRRDMLPPLYLAFIYGTMGEYEKELAWYQEAVRRYESAIAYGDLANSYLNLNRLDEAKATAREAKARQLDSPFMHSVLYDVAFVEHDAAGMEREAAAMGSPSEEGTLLLESNNAAFFGQFAKARELIRRTINSAEPADRKENAARYQAVFAVREALVGNVVMAKQQAKAALALSNDMNVEIFSALGLGMSGDTAQATRLAADLAERYPKNTIIQSITLPTIHAVVALQGGTTKGPDKAIEALAACAPYELSDFLHIYIRGTAYLDARQPLSAVIEFQKILDHQGLVRNMTIGALTRLQLARAYTMSGDTAKGKAAYQDFLTLWKDADPDIPILKQAKVEYAKLQ